MISACVMLLVAGTGFGLKWQHINLLVWQSKHFKCRACMCILAHDMDVKGDYIIYTLQGSDWSRKYRVLHHRVWLCKSQH